MSTILSPEELDAQKKAFEERIKTSIDGGIVTLGLALGKQLGLFDVLCQFDAMATYKEIAQSSNCKERYVYEWLLFMASCHVVDMGDDCNTFFLPFHHRSCLTGDESPLPAAPYVPLMGCAYPQMLQAFKNGGRAGLDASIGRIAIDYDDSLEDYTKLTYLLKQIPEELIRLLEEGIQCCDVGGGRGRYAIELAKKFPKSHFINLDLNEEACLLGKADASRLGLTNITFVIEDATQFPADWSDKFDFIFTTEALHDFPQPDKVLEEMFRSLKPGKFASVVDIKADSDPRLTTQDQGCDYPGFMLYAFSVFHCLPLSLAQENSVGLGTCPGYQKIQQLIKEAGFSDITKLEMPYFYHFLCKKPSKTDNLA